MDSITYIKKYFKKWLQKKFAYVRVLSMETNTDIINQLVAATYTKINDEVFCSILELGADPGDAYRIAYIDVPSDEEFINSPIDYDTSQEEDYDDVVLTHL